MKRYPRSRRMIVPSSGRSERFLRSTPTAKTRASLERVVNMLQRLAIERPRRMFALEEILGGMLENDRNSGE